MGEREKGGQIKNFYNVNRSQHRASDRLRKKVKFRGIFRDKFAEKRSLLKKKSQFRGNFLGKFCLKGVGFAVISRTVLMKQNGKFPIFAGGGNDER